MVTYDKKTEEREMIKDALAEKVTESLQALREHAPLIAISPDGHERALSPQEVAYYWNCISVACETLAEMIEDKSITFREFQRRMQEIEL